MKIAVIGLGSLVWDQRDLDVASDWHADGPTLPVEFARFSSAERLTLVLVEGVPAQPTLWAVSKMANLEEAAANLEAREGCRNRVIGSWPRMDGRSRVSAYDPIIRDWVESKGIDRVIWTALGPKDASGHRRLASEDERLEYLRRLEREERAAAAREYIEKAPAADPDAVSGSGEERVGVGAGRAAVKKIQVDMYAVGLGAAILTQFRLGDGRVARVLADGGMGPGVYSPQRVRQELPQAFTDFSGVHDPRLDLIVGTHYDADHLKGLVPIAEDDSIEIGEVWLPPVKDDTEEVPGHIRDDNDFLAIRFYEDEGGHAIRRYLEVKREEVEALAEKEREVLELLGRGSERRQAELNLPRYRPGLTRTGERQRAWAESWDRERFFVEHVRTASEVTGTGDLHSTTVYDSSVPDIVEIARKVRAMHRSWWGHPDRSDLPITHMPHAALRILPAALASVRKATATNAITAIHLNNLVQALRKRRLPVAPKCLYIDAGRPARFAWDSSRERFIRRARGGGEPVLTLLGPSVGLVEKHREKLPVASWAYVLTFSPELVQRESITASNQLSYIFTIEADEQRLLIAGDSGCYDFRDGDKKYYPDLLAALKPLHVLQVAHHAGRNYDFYYSLVAADFSKQTERSWLLLSHEVDDVTRPSTAFEHFIAMVRREGDDVQLLFTPRPTADKVEDYKELIAPVAPAGPGADKGDVRLSYVVGSEAPGWVVERHHVAVP